ncbi:hypothetical protein GCM10028807_49800 [Spirosoma daeguense]
MNTKTIALFALLAFVGCRKDNEPTPTTTQIQTTYVGDYQLSGTETTDVDGRVTPIPLNQGTLSVFAGTKPNTYFFWEQLGTREVGYFVKVNGTSFTIEPYYDQIFYDGNRWLALVNGTGSFEKGRVQISKSTNNFNINNPTSNPKPNNHQITKKYDFSGNLK